MKQYELVCVVDGGVPSSEVKTMKETIEKHVGAKHVKATDDMGVLPLAYPLNGQTQAHFVSYHLSLDPTKIDGIKKELSLVKGLAKFVFYGMKDNEQFMTFADLKASYQATLPQEEEVEEEESEEQVEEQAEEQQTEEAEQA